MKTKNQSIDLEFAEFLANDSAWAKQGGILYHWQGSHWKAMDVKAMNAFAFRWLHENSPTEATARRAEGLVNAALLLCRDLPELTKRNVVPMERRYVEIHSDGRLEVIAPDAGLGITYVVNAEVAASIGDYHPDDMPETSMFSQFLETSLPSLGVRELVQEFAGYSLLNTTAFQVGQLWVGEGRNGKSVGLEIVAALHAKAVAMRLDCLTGFNLQPLVGASLAIVSEAPRSNINSETVKAVIAGDQISIDRKHRDPIDYKPTAKWLMSANYVPRTHDHSDGWWRRFQIVPWSVQIPEKEVIPDLASKIVASELGIVLDWALQGAARLLRRGRFDISAHELVAARNGAMEDTNPVVAWAQEVNPVAHSVGMRKSEVYAAFREWALDNGYQPPASNEFWKRIKSHFKGKFDLDKRHQVLVNGRERVEVVRFAFGKAIYDLDAPWDDVAPPSLLQALTPEQRATTH